MEIPRRAEWAGPFYGIDFVFPWSLSRPNVTLPVNNANIETLRSLGVDTAWLSSEFEGDDGGFNTNGGHQRLLEREFGIELGSTRQNIEDPAFLKAFLEATGLDPRGKEQPLLRSFLNKDELKLFDNRDEGTERDRDQLLTTAQDRLDVFNKYLEQVHTDRLRRILNNYGLRSAGLFNSQLTIPRIGAECECKNEINNLFFTLSLGLAFATENNIPHAPDFAGDKDVIWLSMYQALEWRFLSFADGDGSAYFNVGPAINYFVGAQFEDFSAVSFRSRIGVQFWRIHGGFEINVFANALRNDQFGGLHTTDLDRVTTGGFLKY